MIGVDESGENAIIVASGANLDTAAAQLPDTALGAGATVLCQNEIRPAESFAVLTRAKRLGARTVLNMAPAAPVPPEVLGALDVLVVNELEAEVAAGVTGQPPEKVARRPGDQLRADLRRHPGRGRLHRRHRRRGLARAGPADPPGRHHRLPAMPSSACSPPGWTAVPTSSKPCARPASPRPAAASRWAPRRPSRSGRRSWPDCPTCRRSPRCEPQRASAGRLPA